MGNVNNSALNNNPNRRAAGTNAGIPPPPKGYSRIWLEVSTTARKDKNGEINPSDAEIEKALFARFGLTAETEGEMQRLKERLGTIDNPFDFVKTSGDATYPFRADGKYKIPVDVEKSLYAKLSGKAAEVKQQIETEKRAPSQTNNPNETVAVKTGFDAAKQQRAQLAAKLADGAGNPSTINNSTTASVGDSQNSNAANEVTLSFQTDSKMPLGDRVAGSFIRQTLDPNYDYIWGDKLPDYVAEAKNKGFQPEILSAQTSDEQLEVRVRLSPRDAEILRGMNSDFQATKTNIDNARAKAQNETNQMFADQGRVVWNSAVNVVEGTINTAIDAALTNGGRNPLPLLNPDRPQVDFSSVKSDYQSEMMRRDINGKVDGDGIKAGQAIELGVTILAPLVIGKVTVPKVAPQSLKNLGGLPEVEAINAASSVRTATAPVKKFSEYIFTPNSKGKDSVFRSLGYAEKDSAKLAGMWEKQAAEKFAKGDYSLGVKDKWGQRITIEIKLEGVGEAKGKVSYMKSGWMLKDDGTITLNTPFSGFTK